MQAGGSWITLKENGDAAVLLNGAHRKHERQPYYRKSRGLIFLELLEDDQPQALFDRIDLTGIEPFTLILYAGGSLLECRWDGVLKNRMCLDTGTPHLWSSVTLYEPAVRARRASWFDQWRQSWAPEGPSGEDIFHFHRKAGDGNSDHDLVICRQATGMRTVSITSIFISPEQSYMRYHDLDKGEETICPLAERKTTAKARALNIGWRLKTFRIKLSHWEYWPFHIVYTPAYFYWLWLSVKARSFFFFNAANPGIENGGWLMEKKSDIYPLLPKGSYPDTLLCRPAESGLHQRLRSFGLDYPLIAKPDIGLRGVGVQLLKTPADLSAYASQSRVPFLLQTFIDYPLEIGIFYYRLPGEPVGHISGIVGKSFLTVTGDGRSTIEELLQMDHRCHLQLPALRKAYGQRLAAILPAGTPQLLVPYGNHSRGALFTDLSRRINPRLTATIDSFCRQIPGFYFGRLDVRFATWEALEAGEQFSVIEVNGAGSEPTHIYDPAHSIFYAWGEICRHLRLLYRISRNNSRRHNIRFLTTSSGLRLLRTNARYLKQLRP